MLVLGHLIHDFNRSETKAEHGVGLPVAQGNLAEGKSKKDRL
jgi:hypothetical protein